NGGPLVGGLPTARRSHPAAVRTHARRAGKRGDAHCAGPAPHAAAKLPWIIAAIPNGVVSATGASGGRETDTGWRDSTGGDGDPRRPRRGPGVAQVDRRTQRSRRRDQNSGGPTAKPA